MTLEDITPYVSECLAGILSGNQELLNQSEQQLHALSRYDGYSLALVSFLGNPELREHIRQLSGVMLRKHVKEHWSTAVSIPSLAVADAYVVPEPVKAQLRAQLPSLLSDSSSKVRAITAYIIAQIGKHDWPEAWPDMISQIIQLLQSQDKNSVHGALRVFAEAADDIFDNKTLEIVQYLMPELLRVFVSEQQYGVRARGRALKIFNKSISLLREATSKSNFVAHATDDSTGSGSGSSSTSAGASNAEAVSNKQIALKLIEDYTPHWINAFLAVLSSPQTETTDYGLKANVLECCTSLVARFPKQTTNLMLPVVTPMWNNIVEGVSFYERLVVNAGDAGDAAAYDSDDEIISFDSFVYTVLQFIDALIERHTMRDVIKSNLAIFVYYIARYAQITWDQLETWEDDLDQFVEEEDEEAEKATVRNECLSLIEHVVGNFKELAGTSIMQAAEQLLQESIAARQNGDANWWKLIEAPLRLFVSVNKHLLHFQKSQLIDITTFMTNLYNQVLSVGTDVSEFLLGTALWAASGFSETFSDTLSQQYLAAAINCILGAQSITPTVISAFRAISVFAENESSKAVIRPHLENLLVTIIQLGEHALPQSLSLLCETLGELAKVDETITARAVERPEHGLGSFVLAVTIRFGFIGDGLLMGSASDLFNILCTNPLAHPHLLGKYMAPFLQFLNDDSLLTLAPTVLEYLGLFARYAPPNSEQNNLLFTVALPAILNRFYGTDEHGILQETVHCLRYYVKSFPNELASWTDSNGVSGPTHLLQVLLKIYAEDKPESVSIFGSSLIIGMIKRMPEVISPHIPELLRAFLYRLTSTDSTGMFFQSLVLVFAYVFQSQLASTVEFLVQTEINGESGLRILMTQWTKLQNCISGTGFERKTMVTSLCALFMAADPRLLSLTVPVEVVASEKNRVTTRSKSKQATRIAQVSVVVKIFQLLAEELEYQQELDTAESGDEDEFEDEDEEGDDEYGENEGGEDGEGGWEDENEDDGSGYQLADSDPYVDLSDMMFFGDPEDDEEVEEDEPDMADDPICQINLKSYLSDFFRTVAASHPAEYAQLFRQLSPLSRECVSAVVNQGQ